MWQEWHADRHYIEIHFPLNSELRVGAGNRRLFSVVDALTRLDREMENAGERTAADQKVSRLLQLAVA